MRYTTIIDITEYPQIYSCMSARLIYFHLVLKAGWGERNQDYCACSIRMLQGDLGMTFAAVRHGLAVLEKYGMIKRGPGGCYVRKFCQPTNPGVRKMTRREQAAEEQRKREQEKQRILAREREQQQAKLEKDLEEQRRTREENARTGGPDLSKYTTLQKLIKQPQKDEC